MKQTILYNQDLGGAISEGISRVESQLVIITPWLNMKGHLKNDILRVIKSKEVLVHIITRPRGENTLHDNNIDELWKIKLDVGIKTSRKGLLRRKYEEEVLTMTFVEHLHAKVLLADDNWLVIGSANLHETSMARNVEIGILIKDPSRDMLETIDRFIGELSGEHPHTPDLQKVVNKCQNCGKAISNPNHSQCYSCYKKAGGEETLSSLVCPRCGGRKNKGYKLCYNCSN